MKAAEQFGWSKTELIANIALGAHDNVVLAIENSICYTMSQEEIRIKTVIHNTICQIDLRRKIWCLTRIIKNIRWYAILWEVFMDRKTVVMRC